MCVYIYILTAKIQFMKSIDELDNLVTVTDSIVAPTNVIPTKFTSDAVPISNCRVPPNITHSSDLSPNSPHWKVKEPRSILRGTFDASTAVSNSKTVLGQRRTILLALVIDEKILTALTRSDILS